MEIRIIHDTKSVGSIMAIQERILRKTDNVSIRIDADLSNKLHEKCVEQKISLNTLINHLLEKQVNWNELADEMGWVTMFRTTFRELMDLVSISKIESIAENTAKADLKNSLNYFYGRIDLDTVLDLFKKKCQSMNVKFRMIQLNENKKIVIQHDLGSNWPYFVIAQLNSVLNDIGFRIINEEYIKQGFSFEITSVGDN